MVKYAQEPKDTECYGHKFKWTPLHQKPDQLRPLIYKYDEVSTRALDRLDEIAPAPAEWDKERKDIQESYEPKDKKNQRDFFKLVKKHANDHQEIGQLWSEINTVPEWVDWEQIDRGQKTFWRYAGAAVTALSFLSLLGGMAASRTVEVLDRTGGFGASVVRRRLLETIQHTLDVHKNLEAIQPSGTGWEASVRVRLLHTSVRRRILELAKENPEYYSTEEHGVPVNDLDTIGTINTFSATVIWVGLPRQGIQMTEQEAADYLAHWRYIAYLMGVPHDWMKAPDEAKAMMESLLVSEYKPTKKSQILANNIIHGLEGHPPMYGSRGFLTAVTWWLNGEELSKELNIEKPSLYHRALVATQCWYFILFGFLGRHVPGLDRRFIDVMRKTYYEYFVENKEKGALGYKAKYTFKWIPSLIHNTTPLGSQDPERKMSSGAFARPGLERTALLTLIFTAAAAGGAGYGLVRMAQQSGLRDFVETYSKIALAFVTQKG